MTRRLAVLPLTILAALGVGAGIARVDVPFPSFDLAYETLPLDDSGAVDRAAAPTRYWYKNRRSRIDSFTLDSGRPVLESSFIMDCDSSRMVQVNWRDRTVMITTFDEWKQAMEKMMELSARYAGQVPGQPAARPNSTGGLVTSTTTWHDTTAQRDWFGLPARYAEYTEATTSSADACYPMDQSTEMRVWTTDLDIPLCIPPFDVTATAMPAVSGGGGGGCTDRHESKVVGAPRRIGFLLRMESVTAEGGRRHSNGYEVTSLSRDSLADSLFQPPAGFETIDLQALYGGMSALDAAGMDQGGVTVPVSAKAAGVIRIGVALSLPPDAPADPRALARDIADWIGTHQGYDAVPLAARDRAAALAEAPGVEADYVLVYDLDEVKAGVSKRGLLGGAVGGALGARAAGGVMKLEVKGDYELAAVPSGERVAREELDEERSTENPQEDLTDTLNDAAGEALKALR